MSIEHLNSIWNREIDQALKDLLEETVRYRDEEGNLAVPKIFPRHPDTDLLERDYPCVTFMNYHQKLQVNRRDKQSSHKIGIDDKGNALMKDPRKPFDMTYQIDFWAKYQDDMNEMTRTFLEGIDPVSHLLPVKTNSGEQDYVNMVFNNLAGKDFVTDNEKGSKFVLFHKIYSFDIWGRLDSRPIQKHPYSLGIEISRKDENDKED